MRWPYGLSKASTHSWESRRLYAFTDLYTYQGLCTYSDPEKALNPHLRMTLKFCSWSVSSVAQSCLTLCDPMNCSMPCFRIHHQLLKLAQTRIHQVGDAIQPSIFCHPLLLLPPIFPSTRVFSRESVLPIRWPRYWNFSFSISPSNEYSGLISFRMDWLDLLVVQGTLKSLLQHLISKESILCCSAFFLVQLSHPYMTTRKTIALTLPIFVVKIMSLLFNMLSQVTQIVCEGKGKYFNCVEDTP